MKEEEYDHIYFKWLLSFSWKQKGFMFYSVDYTFLDLIVFLVNEKQSSVQHLTSTGERSQNG